MKKIMVLIITLSMIAFVFGACDRKDADRDKTTPISTGTSSSQPTATVANKTPTATAQTPAPSPAAKEQLISVGKTATADHVQAPNDIAYICDGEEAPSSKDARWSCYDNVQTNYTHWAMIDLGQEYAIGRNEIYFEFAALYYTVEISADGQNGWTKIFDSYEEDAQLGPNVFDEFDAGGAKGRYIRISTYCPEEAEEELLSFLSSTTGGHPYFSIFEWFVYDAPSAK